MNSSKLNVGESLRSSEHYVGEGMYSSAIFVGESVCASELILTCLFIRPLCWLKVCIHQSFLLEKVYVHESFM